MAAQPGLGQTLLALKMERWGPGAKEHGWPPEAGKTLKQMLP